MNTQIKEFAHPDYLLDNEVSAFDKREYLNAGGKKKRKKKKVKKHKKIRHKNGKEEDVVVESEQLVSEDGTPLTKEEQAQNAAAEKEATTTALKDKKINPDEVDVKENSAGVESTDTIFGVKKIYVFGGAGLLGLLTIGTIIYFATKKAPAGGTPA